MPVNRTIYESIRKELDAQNVTLVAVSKTKPAADIMELYELGQRDFGENYVQELVDKAAQLPTDIRWHFIGHLQRNKVKFIVPFVHLVHGVDSWKLLIEINAQGQKINRVIDCLLQAYIASEETKFGLDETELDKLMQSVQEYHRLNQLNHIRIRGFMGMASFTDNMTVVQAEFRQLNSMYKKYQPTDSPVTLIDSLSMGMSSDYQLAITEGSNMVRIGSLLFGERSKTV